METELIYVLIALISALGLLLIVFTFLHIRGLRDLRNLNLELDALKKEKTDLEKGALTSVNIQAKEIIDAANKKASEIISAVTGISEEEKKVLTAQFQQMLAANLKDYQLTASKFSQTYDSFISNIGRDVKARLDMGLNKIIADAENQIKNTSTVLNSSLSNLYKGYEAEVSEYKKGILNQVDKLGLDIIKQVSLKVLGKTLSRKEQEDLVLKSLEEAKKLGFFE